MEKIKVTPTRHSVCELQPSLIRQLANSALGRTDIIKLWFGQPDKPTPTFIREAAKTAIDEGQTFYEANLGMPQLRQTISSYMNRIYGTQLTHDNIIVTISGTTAIVLAGQCIISEGDHIVVQSPIFPNLHASLEVLGAHVTRVPIEPKQGQWHFDLQRLFDSCRDDTRLIILNSPSNPTGWIMSDDDQQSVLDFCRQRGLWLISDEVYNRIVYNQKNGRIYAPTFADKVTEYDRVLILNSFSKSWAMSGWRLGWITAPRSLSTTFEMLTEFTNSCVFGPTQIAGSVALEQGEDFISETNKRYQEARDFLMTEFSHFPKIHCPNSDAAFYLFFAVEGMKDSYQSAQRIINEVQVGFAPGVAFGPEGEGYLRLCYAASMSILEEMIDRVRPIFS